ncbi:MAG: FAD-binding oxidoreductase [Actinomycetia bacterium]|nr:FAD-binding oxidoreductase [Actinomycetes bacterium]
MSDRPERSAYDVVIAGGAVMGSSIAWFLAHHFDFDGSILVVERDPTYESASTSHTNSCMRQQFSNAVNIKISKFGAEFVRNFRSYLGDDPEVPDIFVNHFGYMYLAGDDTRAETLRANQAIQAAHGAGTRIMSPSEISAAYPFYNVDDIVCGSHNVVDEGYFDSGTMFDWWRRQARQRGVEYLGGEVTDVQRDGQRITGVSLASGEQVQCGTLVNATGPRAVELARMAGLHLPVEPRKRYTFVFDAAEPLDRDLPLTIDPSGVHVRSEGSAYMAGCTPDIDPAVAYDDFVMDGDIFEKKVWPVLAHRIPAFERIKVNTRWAGHYAHNTLDHNVVVGPHHEVQNFIFANGFSGHGMQQSPAIGRGVAELITHGSFQSLDLTPLGYRRIVDNEPFVESAII